MRRKLGFESASGGDNTALLAQIADLQSQVADLQEQIFPDLDESVTRFGLDLRYSELVRGISPTVASKLVDQTRLQYLYTWYLTLSNALPADIFNTQALYIYFYNVLADTAILPSVESINTRLRYLTFDNSYTNGASLGEAGLVSIPSTWSNLRGLQRIYLRRNELTDAQQQALIISMEAAIIAGMGSDYNSTHYLYLNNNSTGANASLTQAPLVALGWTASSATRLQKTIAGKVWRVEHR